MVTSVCVRSERELRLAVPYSPPLFAFNLFSALRKKTPFLLYFLSSIVRVIQVSPAQYELASDLCCVGISAQQRSLIAIV